MVEIIRDPFIAHKYFKVKGFFFLMRNFFKAMPLRVPTPKYYHHTNQVSQDFATRRGLKELFDTSNTWSPKSKTFIIWATLWGESQTKSQIKNE